MLGKLLESVGKIDVETRLALGKFILRATKSGDANNYIKSRLQRIMEEDDSPTQPRPVEGRAYVVTPNKQVRR